MPLSFPEDIPNLLPRDIAITDPGPIVRAPEPGRYEPVVRRWSWPGPSGKPVYNFRSDGRQFSSGRCLIAADGFYEFTSAADPKSSVPGRMIPQPAYQRDEGPAWLTRTAITLSPA